MSDHDINQVFTQIVIRRDKSTVWSYENPVLAEGELGLETDTNRLKAGDDRNSWNNLPYIDFVSAEQITSLLRLLVNADKFTSFFVVDKLENAPSTILSPENGDFLYAIDKRLFFKYSQEEDKWTEVTGKDVGADVTIDVVKELISSAIHRRIAHDLETENPEMVLGAEVGPKIQEKINDTLDTIEEKSRELRESIRTIYEPESRSVIFVDQMYGKSSNPGSREKPLMSLREAFGALKLIPDRESRIGGVFLLSDIVVSQDNFFVPNFLGFRRLEIAGFEENRMITFTGRGENSLEVDMNCSPVMFSNLSLNFGKTKNGVFSPMGSRVFFSGCKLTATSLFTENIVNVDALSNPLFDSCTIHGNNNENGVALYGSYGIVKNTIFRGVRYAFNLNSSLCVTENNQYFVGISYLRRNDNAEVIG